VGRRAERDGDAVRAGCRRCKVRTREERMKQRARTSGRGRGHALPGSIASFSLFSLFSRAPLRSPGRRPYRSQACVHGLRQAQPSTILELTYIICNALRGRARGASTAFSSSNALRASEPPIWKFWARGFLLFTSQSLMHQHVKRPARHETRAPHPRAYSNAHSVYRCLPFSLL
jgi:hypothetical protein